MRGAVAFAIGAAVLVGGPSCDTHSDGIEVAVGFQSTSTPASFETDLGYAIALDTAYVNISAVELMECPSISWRALGGPSRARAHTAGSPTVLGEPHVIDLVGALGLVEHVGTFLPPPGEYCALHVTVAPADADALGLPVEVDMVGKSVHLAGTLTPTGGSPRAFVLESVAEAHVELPFAEPLVLDLDMPTVGLVVATDHLAWLDGINFDTDDANAQAAALIDHLIASLALQPQP